MEHIKSCPECGVPEPFSQGQRWLNNGDIVQGQSEHARMAFIECEYLDRLFRRVGEKIGVPIDHMVINIVARGVELYMSNIIPAEVREMAQARAIDMAPITRSIIDLCHVIGYGKYEFIGYRFEKDENDYSKLRILEPFSILLAAGSLAGVICSLAGGEHSVSFQEISPGLYELTTHWTTYPEILKEKLKLTPYERSSGDLELESCSLCGMPRMLEDCEWDLPMGTVTNKRTGYRMTILGPGLMDSVFEALEWELGDTIPRTVIEAQRDYARGGFTPIDFADGFDDLRLQIAIRGLGNLREFEMTASGAELRLDNACLPFLSAGLLQGSFERIHDVNSTLEWEQKDDGSLRVEVSPIA